MRRISIWKMMSIAVGVAVLVGLASHLRRPIHYQPMWYTNLEWVGNVGPKAAGEEHTLDEWVDRAVRLAELLRREGVAPAGTRSQAWPWSEELAQPPAAGSPILPLPEPPPGYGNLHEDDSYADGTVAATVYGYTGDAPAPVPCVLAINDGVATVYTDLVSELRLIFHSWIVPYNQGQGLLVFVRGKVPLSGDWSDSEEWRGLFDLEAPEWEPKLVTDSKRLGSNAWLDLVGQSADGSKVWLYGRYARGSAGGGQVWVYDAIAGTTDLVCNTGYTIVQGVILSPDEKLLALISAPPKPFSIQRTALRVIDLRANIMHTLVGLLDPVGWSATVPRRLYFIDLDHDVWRLDIP